MEDDPNMPQLVDFFDVLIIWLHVLEEGPKTTKFRGLQQFSGEKSVMKPICQELAFPMLLTVNYIHSCGIVHREPW